MKTTSGICNFCKNHGKVFTSKGATICRRCVYKNNIVCGNAVPGSVKCPHCSNTGGFTVVSALGGAPVNYVPSGISHVAYFPETIHIPKQFVKEVFCSACNKSLPNWILDFTTYD